MNCPKCNKPVPANARFCGSCGQSIEGAASPSAAPPGLPARVKNIVLAPRSEWPVIAPEPTTISPTTWST